MQTDLIHIAIRPPITIADQEIPVTQEVSTPAAPTVIIKEDTLQTAIINIMRNTYTGQVTDAVNGDPIPYASVIIYGNGIQLGGQSANVNGMFSIDITGQADSITISAAGYKAASFSPDTNANTFPLDRIADLENVTVTASKKKTNYAWLLLILIPLLLVEKKKGTKGLGALKTSDVWPWLLIAAALLGWKVIKEILIMLGLWKGKGKQDVENQLTDPGSPWNTNFWANNTTPDQWAILEARRSDFVIVAKMIHDAFTIFQDDFNQVLAAIEAMTSQVQVSYLAAVFADEYNEALLTFLTDGGGILPWDGLNDAHLEQITTFVKNLPLK